MPFARPAIFQSTLPVWGVTAVKAVADGMLIFQSTLPVWGVTDETDGDADTADISIHTPRVGSDSAVLPFRGHTAYFNPHSPCGE